MIKIMKKNKIKPQIVVQNYEEYFNFGYFIIRGQNPLDRGKVLWIVALEEL